MAVLKLLTKLTRWLWLMVATVVIGYAVIVMSGRLLLPSLDKYRPELRDYLSDTLGVELEVGSLSGAWPRLTPIISAQQILLRANSNIDSGIQIGELSAELSPLQSLSQGQLIWRQLSLKQVKLTLDEDADGGWSIAGIPLGKGNSGIQPIDMLFYSRLIKIDSVEITLDFYSGTMLTLRARNMLAENSEDFHRILANLTSAEGEEMARFVFEATGDYKQPESFFANGYLRLSQISLGGGLSAVARKWFPAQVEKAGNLKANVDSEIWFDIKADGRAELVGRINSNAIPLKWAADLPPVTNLQAEMTGWYQPGADWGVTLQSLDFEWGEENITPLDIRFGQRVGARWGEIGLDVNHLNIGIARDLLLKTGLLNDRLTNLVSTLRPAGRAEQVSVDFSATEDKPSFLVRAQLRDVSLQPWKGAPGASGISGYLESGLANGLFVVNADNVSANFAKLFDEPIRQDHVQGQVNWRWDREKSAVYVASGPLNIAGEQGEIKAQLYLDLPLRRPEIAPQMYLQIGGRNTHSRYRNRFIPQKLNPKLKDWLDSAIGDAEVREVGVIFRGSLRKGQQQNRTIQLYLDVADGHLKFQPDWPALEQVNGQVVVNNTFVDGYVNSARIGELEVKEATTRLRPAESGKGNILSVQASGRGDAAAVLDLLENSPVSNRIDALKDWRVSGAVDVHGKLGILLGGESRPAEYSLTADIQNGKMFHPKYALDITEIQGALDYHSTNGFTAKEITGKLWGGAMVASLETIAQELKISADGKLDVSAVGKHYGLEAEDIAKGETQVHGTLFIPLRSGVVSNAEIVPRIEVVSDLKGVDVYLPEPFAKKSMQDRHLLAKMELSALPQVVVQYGSNVRAGFELDGGKLVRGYLGINRSDLKFPDTSELLLAADIETINLVDWESSLLKAIDSSDVSVKGLRLPPTRFDVRLGELGVSDLKLSRVHLEGNLSDSVLHARLESPTASGRLDIPLDNDKDMIIALRHLTLPEPSSDDAEKRESFDPRTLRSMVFSVGKLSVGDREIGNARFRLHATGFGLAASDIYAELFGLKVGGENSETSLTWHYDGEVHNTQFNGVLQADDIMSVTENLGLGKILDSKHAVFQSNLRWEGRPWQISPQSLAGQLAFTMEKGSFYQDTGGATNALLRIVSLFNFETWLKRLKLNFADLFKKGISYDQVSGSFILGDGLLNFSEPIVAEMPSGKLQMQGTIDMLNEEIDARFVATLPVGTNLPWIAALVVNLPAAAGVFLMSKILKKQVDNLSSISYRIEGSWDEPDMRVERIFSDQNRAEKKKAQKAQKKAEKESEKESEKLRQQNTSGEPT